MRHGAPKIKVNGFTWSVPHAPDCWDNVPDNAPGMAFIVWRCRLCLTEGRRWIDPRIMMSAHNPEAPNHAEARAYVDSVEKLALNAHAETCCSHN